jgi:hypothetical protein
LVGKPEEKRPVGRPRCRWKDNIKMDLQEVRWGGKDWIDLAVVKDKWGVWRVLVGKPEGKRPVGRPRRRWKDNIKMDLQKWDRETRTGLTCL